MPTITATFKNNYGESKLWTILDLGRDPSAPSQVFRDYLEPDQVTDPLTLYSADGVYGLAGYQRSDGQLQRVDVSDQSEVDME